MKPFSSLSGNGRWPRWWMYLGLCLLICGAKLWLINRFGNAAPSGDEWTGEGKVIASSMEGTLSPAQLFEHHNEHRIVFTRLLVLGLFWANRQWDPLLQMVAQAPLHALAILAFVALAGTFMSGVGKAALAVFAGCVTIVPFGWRNTLSGFQSVFYFMLLFGILVIWLCWRHKALTPRWWLGAGLALASLFTMAAGVFFVAGVTAFLTMRLVIERGKEWRARLAGIAILTAITAFGVLITPRHVDDTYVAANMKSFLWAFTGILAWPCGAHWAWVIIQAPLILLALACGFRRVPFDDGRWFVIIVGGTLWLNAMATAYQRSTLWVASKYCDLWSMSLIVLCACLYFLRRSLGERGRVAVYAMTAVWLSACCYGALDRVVNLLPGQLMDNRSATLETESYVREYLSTGNTALIQGKIPYPDPGVLKQILDSGSIRRALPSNLIDQTPPLVPLKQKSSGSGFVQGGYSDYAPALGKTVFGCYPKSGTRSKSGITLQFKVPRGTQQVDLQVAGYPNARGMTLKVEEGHVTSRSIVPSFDPGNNWQTISVGLSRKTTAFKISAKDESDGAWIAFSAPTVCNGHLPGLWARWLAGGSFWFIDSGLVLLSLGAAAAIREMPEA